MANLSAEAILVLTVASCGVLCLLGFLISFALSRRLADRAFRPMIGLGELVKPLFWGMLLGLLILACRLGDPSGHRLAVAAPQIPVLLSALVSVGLAGACAGAISAIPQSPRHSIAPADLVRRLCVAGDTHEDATARVALRLALAAGYDPASASDLLVAATLHDVGQAGIPNVLVNKVEPLTAEERRVLQSHTRIGYRMLARSHEPMLDLAADIALHHHERWDGTGYPSGLAGEAIPLASRVVALAEQFDLLLSGGANRPAASVDGTVRAIRDGAGTQFDPRLVALLLADLPGMLAARNGGAVAAPRNSASAPVIAWRPPGRFRPLRSGHIAV